jgi:hypothetical protein
VRKSVIAAALIVCTVAALFLPSPTASGMFCFTGANDTLLPLRDATMPTYIGSLMCVPYTVFSYVEVTNSYSPSEGHLYMYKGQKQLYFYIDQGTTFGQDGVQHSGVPAKRLNGTIYVPLDFVCAYFGLEYSLTPYDPASVLRIRSSSAAYNDKTFAGVYKRQMQTAYNDYFSSASPTPTAVTPPPPGSSDIPSPGVTPEPTYEDVTVYLSFFGLSDGGIGGTLDILSAAGLRACFFVSAEELAAVPDLIRRIYGDGHTIGVRLETGTYAEYQTASALLFEAVKLRTSLVSSGDDARETALAAAEQHGLIYRLASRVYDGAEASAPPDPADVLPTARSARFDARFAYSGDTPSALSGLLSYLREKKYNIERIVETTAVI